MQQRRKAFSTGGPLEQGEMYKLENIVLKVKISPHPVFFFIIVANKPMHLNFHMLALKDIVKLCYGNHFHQIAVVDHIYV